MLSLFVGDDAYQRQNRTQAKKGVVNQALHEVKILTVFFPQWEDKWKNSTYNYRDSEIYTLNSLNHFLKIVTQK